MSQTVIKVENLSKAYQIGQIGTGTISRDLERFWATKIMGKEDPFLKIGETNDRSVKGESDIVWSLKDINFEINQGDAVGIIGKNGAGKSTLLKLLSRVTSPTTGEIKVKGRIASLLEVGTGFHPELSGRENIYLNGAILGMRKKEITRKLDEIIDFSGVERYIDTPVKRYSSGMYVRLAFAVAAHLESEILIVDEVLSVGDAEFQKKCLGKMGDISKGEGRTVLFVSHNMAAVKSLCNEGIVLENGKISFNGKISDSIESYLREDKIQYSSNFLNEFIANQNDECFKLNIFLIHQKNTSENNFYTNKNILIDINYEIIKDVLGLRIGFDLIDLNSGVVIFRSFHDDIKNQILTMKKGNYSIQAAIPANLLIEGIFAIKPAIGIHNNRWILFDEKIILKFNVTNIGGLNSAFADTRPGFIMPEMSWKYFND
jgi:lipopolysaccharide transport system ATP-binding protein